jgi:membrane fusion protein (multidrug efflux system)
MENKTTGPVTAAPKRSNKGFIIVLSLLVIFGTWFGVTKFVHAKHHAETDDAR